MTALPCFWPFLCQRKDYLSYLTFAGTYKEARDRVNKFVIESDYESMPETMVESQSRVGRRVRKPGRFHQGEMLEESVAENGGIIPDGETQQPVSKKSKP